MLGRWDIGRACLLAQDKSHLDHTAGPSGGEGARGIVGACHDEPPILTYLPFKFHTVYRENHVRASSNTQGALSIFTAVSPALRRRRLSADTHVCPSAA